MEEKLINALAQTPAILALLLIVWMFGKHLARKDVMFAESMREMHQDNITAREQSRMVIERNTVEATHNTNAVREMTQTMKELIKK